MNVLLIFLKEPIPGKVKTRLASTLGPEEAARCYRAMVAVLLQQLEGLTNTHVRFCYAPDDAGEAVSFWILPQFRGEVTTHPDGFLFSPSKHAPDFTIDFSPQGEGDLGQRLERASAQAFSEGFSKVAVIGTDCVDCGARWVNAAFLQTRPQQAVIGPAHDGGYYLLATATHYPQLFHNIPWSSSQTLSATETAAASAALSVSLLPPLADIDDHASWESALSSPIGGKLKAAHKRLQ